MIVNEDLFLVVLPLSFGGQKREINLSLILDRSNGASLVDTGLHGQEEEILRQAEEAGVQAEDIHRILVTHHDIDHIGSAHALVELTGAKVLAPIKEAAFLEGEKPPQKAPPPERLAQMPEFKAMLDQRKAIEVDEPLKDGQRLDIAGGVRVLATPGHTVGHTSFYLERSKTLIAGDALTSEEGKLNGPSEGATADMETAIASVRKLVGLNIETIICYHGGVVQDGNSQIRRILQNI